MDAVALRSEAVAHFEAGRLQESREALVRLTSLQPEDAPAWNMLAAVSGMLGKFQETVDFCETALAFPDPPLGTHKNYANALIRLGRHQDAIRALMNAHASFPEDAETCAMLGQLHAMAGDSSAAASFHRKALLIAPGHTLSAIFIAGELLESGDYHAAAETCQAALESGESHSGLLLLLAKSRLLAGDSDSFRNTVCKMSGRHEHSREMLVKLLRELHNKGKHDLVCTAGEILAGLFPEERRFFLMLADSQIKSGLLQEAIGTLRDFTAAPPSYDTYILLAEACHRLGDFENTRTCLLDAGNSKPDSEEPVALLATLYQDHGDPASAIRTIAAHLENHPDSYTLNIAIGNLYYQAGDNLNAEKHFRNACRITPDSAPAFDRLGMSLLNRKVLAEAQRCFEQAIHIDPEFITAYCNLGLLQRTGGDYDAALRCYDKALSLNPEFESAIAGKASVLERVHDIQGAIDILQPAVNANSRDINILLAFAAISHKADRKEAAVTLLENALLDPSLPASERMQVHFMLGKLLDKLGRYDAAFASYERGNNLNPSPFAGEAQTRLTESVISAFSRDRLRRLPRSSNTSDELLFIVGMPRSGTTLTEQIISSHPRAFGAGELTDICEIAATLPASMGSQLSFPLGMENISSEILDRFSFRHLDALKELAPGHRIITDKMPSNFLFLGLIELLYPRARVIHCVRDPMDTCLSCYFQQFSSGQYFSYSQQDLALYYSLYRKVMEHWKSALSLPVLEVRYEDLVDNTEQVSRVMLEFAGLDWDPACTDFHKSERTVLTASYDQVRNPIYRSSVQRWKHYRQHLAVLRDALSVYYPDDPD